MKEQIGILELKELFISVITMGNAAGRTFEDKKIGMSDIKDLFIFLGAAKDLVAIDFKLATIEFKDLDHDELAQLMAIVEEHFDIPEEKLEDKVEQIFGLAVRYYSLISETINMIQNPEVMG